MRLFPVWSLSISPLTLEDYDIQSEQFDPFSSLALLLLWVCEYYVIQFREQICINDSGLRLWVRMTLFSVLSFSQNVCLSSECTPDPFRRFYWLTHFKEYKASKIFLACHAASLSVSKLFFYLSWSSWTDMNERERERVDHVFLQPVPVRTFA